MKKLTGFSSYCTYRAKYIGKWGAKNSQFCLQITPKRNQFHENELFSYIFTIEYVA